MTAVSISAKAAATSSFLGGRYSGIEPSAFNSSAIPFCTSCKKRMRARKNAAFCRSGSLVAPSSTRVHEASAAASCAIGIMAVLTRSSAQTAKSDAISACVTSTEWNILKSAAAQIVLTRNSPTPPDSFGKDRLPRPTVNNRCQGRGLGLPILYSMKKRQMRPGQHVRWSRITETHARPFGALPARRVRRRLTAHVLPIRGYYREHPADQGVLPAQDCWHRTV